MEHIRILERRSSAWLRRASMASSLALAGGAEQTSRRASPFLHVNANPKSTISWNLLHVFTESRKFRFILYPIPVAAGSRYERLDHTNWEDTQR